MARQEEAAGNTTDAGLRLRVGERSTVVETVELNATDGSASDPFEGARTHQPQAKQVDGFNRSQVSEFQLFGLLFRVGCQSLAFSFCFASIVIFYKMCAVLKPVDYSPSMIDPKVTGLMKRGDFIVTPAERQMGVSVENGSNSIQEKYKEFDAQKFDKIVKEDIGKIGREDIGKIGREDIGKIGREDIGKIGREDIGESKNEEKVSGGRNWTRNDSSDEMDVFGVDDRGINKSESHFDGGYGNHKQINKGKANGDETKKGQVVSVVNTSRNNTGVNDESGGDFERRSGIERSGGYVRKKSKEGKVSKKKKSVVKETEEAHREDKKFEIVAIDRNSTNEGTDETADFKDAIEVSDSLKKSKMGSADEMNSNKGTVSGESVSRRSDVGQISGSVSVGSVSSGGDSAVKNMYSDNNDVGEVRRERVKKSKKAVKNKGRFNKNDKDDKNDAKRSGAVAHEEVKKAPNKEYLDVKKAPNKEYLDVKKAPNKEYLDVKKAKTKEYLDDLVDSMSGVVEKEEDAKKTGEMDGSKGEQNGRDPEMLLSGGEVEDEIGDDEEFVRPKGKVKIERKGQMKGKEKGKGSRVGRKKARRQKGKYNKGT